MFEILRNIEIEPFILSLKLAFITTLFLLIVSLPIAWLLSNSKSKLKPLIEAIIAMPIVLPPSVIGFYILIIFAPDSILGKFFEDNFNISLLFSFWGLVLASVIYSFPFMVQPLQSGFESLNKNVLEASFLSGKGKFVTLFMVALPNIKPSLITAIIITFAHTIGEFGVIFKWLGGSNSR